MKSCSRCSRCSTTKAHPTLNSKSKSDDPHRASYSSSMFIYPKINKDRSTFVSNQGLGAVNSSNMLAVLRDRKRNPKGFGNKDREVNPPFLLREILIPRGMHSGRGRGHHMQTTMPSCFGMHMFIPALTLSRQHR